jgi:DNA invertase Pin-like site-specific DNA recombinase
MLIGYARVSSNDRNTAAKVATLKAAKCGVEEQLRKRS